MKVLLVRINGFITSRFSLYAFQYNWFVKSDREIHQVMVNYLQSNHVLHPRSLAKKLLKLCAIINDIPEYFNKIFTQFILVPLDCLEHYIMEDLKLVS